MKTVRVGGVPEHFNLPWHLCIENNDFKSEDLRVEWTDFPGGTGAMTSALRNDEIDVAIILPEGIIKDISEGNPSKIVQTFVRTPLIWGIHVAHDSPYQTLEELHHKKAAISRKGSGSELMAYVNAKNQGWDPSKLQFEIVGDIAGAVKALKNDTAQYFMWEHFTTKPLVDKAIFRRVADCPTPWPSFVIAVRDEILITHPQNIKQMLDIVNTKTALFKKIPKINEILAFRYDQKPEDIKKWLEVTSWSQSHFKENDLNKVQKILFDLNLINEKSPSSKVIFNI